VETGPDSTPQRRLFKGARGREAGRGFSLRAGSRRIPRCSTGKKGDYGKNLVNTTYRPTLREPFCVEDDTREGETLKKKPLGLSLGHFVRDDAWGGVRLP